MYRAGAALGICAWLVVIGAGYRALWLHAYTPGPEASAVSTWPADFPRDTTRPTLIMFVHPECGCSSASLGELARVMARADAPVDVRVIFAPVAGAYLQSNALWAQANAMPGVVVRVDVDGAMVRGFGALVSGHALLFDRDGRLIFSGGITSARGHAGDNLGEDAIIEAINNGQAPLAATPVFGCLFSERVAS